MKIHVIHHNDHDGYCSAAIVEEAYKDKELETFEYDYDKEFDKKLLNCDKLVIVDFSFEPEIMLKLPSSTLWIDHHITAIDGYKKHKYKFNVFLNHKRAACHLCYKYFKTRNLIDFEYKSIELIGNYDIWNLDSEVLDFHYGLPSNYDSKIWNNIIKDVNFNKIMSNGKLIHKSVRNSNLKKCENIIETSIDGIPALSLNSNSFSSLIFNDYKNNIVKTGILIVYVFTKNKKWKTSLYTNNKNIDVSKIATKYKGGGHKQAAGFITDKFEDLPF